MATGHVTTSRSFDIAGDLTEQLGFGMGAVVSLTHWDTVRDETRCEVSVRVVSPVGEPTVLASERIAIRVPASTSSRRGPPPRTSSRS
jgi:hypothetical protein